jgi:hypothetical protein
MYIKYLEPKNKIVYNNKECIVIKFYEEENLCLIAVPGEIGYEYLKVNIDLLSKKIVFKENQNTIKFGKNKVCTSQYKDFIELHIVMPACIESGYLVKYVDVFEIENVYLLDELKKLEFKAYPDEWDLDIINNHLDLDVKLDIKYWWSGSYAYDKKTF